MIGLGVVAAGVLMVAAGATWLFGPVALIVCGVVLVVAGLCVDLDEEALRGKPAEPPSP